MNTIPNATICFQIANLNSISPIGTCHGAGLWPSPSRWIRILFKYQYSSSCFARPFLQPPPNPTDHCFSEMASLVYARQFIDQPCILLDTEYKTTPYGFLFAVEHVNQSNHTSKPHLFSYMLPIQPIRIMLLSIKLHSQYYWLDLPALKMCTLIGYFT